MNLRRLSRALRTVHPPSHSPREPGVVRLFDLVTASMLLSLGEFVVKPVDRTDSRKPVLQEDRACLLVSVAVLVGTRVDKLEAVGKHEQATPHARAVLHHGRHMVALEVLEAEVAAPTLHEGADKRRQENEKERQQKDGIHGLPDPVRTKAIPPRALGFHSGPFWAQTTQTLMSTSGYSAPGNACAAQSMPRVMISSGAGSPATRALCPREL